MSGEDDSKRDLKLVSMGMGDDRFVGPTTGEGGALTTFDQDFPRVLSEGTSEQLEGDYLRHSVLPVMMDHMAEAMQRMDLPNPADPLSRTRNRTLVLTGAPGIGKTTLASVIQKVTGGGLHMIDCYDQEISELVSETTIDGHHKWRELEKTLDERLRKGELKDISRGVLREAFGEFIVRDGEDAESIDFSKLADANDGKAKKRMEALQTVAEHEGIISRGGNHLIGKKPGPLYEALKAIKEGKKPQIILLDEFARRRDAAGGNPRLYEILAGTRPDPDETITIDGGNGESFTLSNNDIRRNGSLVIFTGNYQDGRDDSIKPLPDALASRLSPIGIENLSERDWAHRIQQLLCGAPISTLYAAQKDRWNGTGEWAGQQHSFDEYLNAVRTRGMNESEKGKVPEHHSSFVDNWASVKDGTEQLAEFFAELAQMENPRSALYERAEKKNNDQILSVQDEVQTRPKDHPASQARFDLRLAQQWIEEAMQTTVPVAKPGAHPKRRNDQTLTAPEEEFGTRLVQLVENKISRLYPEGNPGNTHIRDFVKASMLRHGIFLPHKKEVLDTAAEEMLQAQADLIDVRTTGEVHSIAELLNTSRERGKDALVKAWQGILAYYIQSKYPEQFEAGVEVPPDQVISYSAVRKILDTMTPALRDKAFTWQGGALGVIPALEISPPEPGSKDVQFSAKLAMQQVINPAEAHKLKAMDKPVFAEIKSHYQRIKEGKKSQPGDPDVVRLLMTLAMPGAASEILPQLFISAPKDGSNLIFQVAGGMPNPSNLGITTLQIGKKENGEPDAVQLLVQFEPGEQGQQKIQRATLIGDGAPIPKKLAEYLNKAGNVRYISRQEENAEQQIRAEVADMIRYGNQSIQAAGLREITEDTVSGQSPKEEAEDVLRDALLISTGFTSDYVEHIRRERKTAEPSKDFSNLSAESLVGDKTLTVAELLTGHPDMQILKTDTAPTVLQADLHAYLPEERKKLWATMDVASTNDMKR